MQPYFLPYIGYLQLMNAVDQFVLYDDVNYINKGWINRNRLLVNGKDYLFTVPLKEASQNKLINEIELSDDPQWRGKLLKTAEQAYKKAPFYGQAYPIMEQIVNLKNPTIAELILESLIILKQYLSIETEIVATSSSYKNADLKAQTRILDICQQAGATHYINPIGGVELYDKAVFAAQNIRLSFIKSKAVQYPQFKNEFVPWLSIVDVLMFNEPAVIQGFLGEFELV